MNEPPVADDTKIVSVSALSMCNNEKRAAPSALAFTWSSRIQVSLSICTPNEYTDIFILKSKQQQPPGLKKETLLHCGYVKML